MSCSGGERRGFRHLRILYQHNPLGMHRAAGVETPAEREHGTNFG
jgi:hypothetical protein